jgi:hypothetical protein
LLGKREAFAGTRKPEALNHQLSDMRCVLTNVCIDQFRSQYLLGIKASSLDGVTRNRGLISCLFLSGIGILTTVKSKQQKLGVQ